MPAHDDPPPPPHPLWTTYEKYVQETAMVTRTVLNGTAVSYVVSWILVTDYALACIPHFVVGHQYYEVYRLMTAMAVNSDFVSLLLAFLTFAPTGNTLENSLGSFVLVWLTLVVFTLGTNVIFTLTCLLLSSISDDSTWKMSSSSGIWTALIGLLALECCLAAKNVPGSSRKLLFWDIPVLYYPLALLALFSLLSGRFQLAYVISVCLGYAIGHELCPWLNLSPSAVKRWEESSIFLNTRFRQQGWVLGPSVMGPAAWSQEASGESRQSLFSSLASMVQPRPVGGNELTTQDGGAGSIFRTGHRADDEAATSLSTSSVGGRTLGGTSQRRVDARTARLQALERRHEDV